MSLAQTANETIDRLVLLGVCWKFSFDLDWPNNDTPWAWLRDDKIKSLIAMRKVYVPTGIG